MKNRINSVKTLSMVAAVSLLMAACASTPKAPEGSVAVRSKLSQLQSDPQLASRAPVAINDAEQAVRSAEKPTKDKALSQHLVWIADHKVDTAAALAQSRLLEDQRKGLSEQRVEARLDARTQEADKARSEAELAKQQADAAKQEAASANQQSELARQQAADLQRQVAELNAKATDRGLVVTLGDLLFETGRAELKNNSASNLGKLSAFLNKYPDRSVIIEGHTDSTGAEDYNLGLSQRRADSVKTYLLTQGIAANRIVSTGKGEGSPVSGNESATGRQMNRRVEVIIANPATAK
jgi:outer membrane protein OmpA-like peptidoglycan-associated protein